MKISKGNQKGFIDDPVVLLVFVFLIIGVLINYRFTLAEATTDDLEKINTMITELKGTPSEKQFKKEVNEALKDGINRGEFKDLKQSFENLKIKNNLAN
ncbi:hypothetical protein R4575_18110 [Acinetobacter baumannii]|nr:hypothetical protein [Acinetobacter baumannii]